MLHKILVVLQQNHLPCWLFHSLVCGLPTEEMGDVLPQVGSRSSHKASLWSQRLSRAWSSHDRWQKHKKLGWLEQAHLKLLFMGYLLTYHWPKEARSPSLKRKGLGLRQGCALHLLYLQALQSHVEKGHGYIILLKGRIEKEKKKSFYQRNQTGTRKNN